MFLNMSGILKEVIYLEDLVEDDFYHPIKMVFTKDGNSSEIYPYQTSLENQFYSSVNRNKGLSDKEALEKLSLLKTYLGKLFDINLHKISVLELTNGKYISLEFNGYADEYGYDDNEDCDENDMIEEFRRATYRSREDLVEILKLQICLGGFDDSYLGIKRDGTSEKLDEKLVFPIVKEEQKLYEIPYDGFPEIDEFYIINKMAIENIEIGQYLASSIKYNRIRNFDGAYLIKRLKEYRNYIYEINNVNSSIKKKLAFWESKESIEPFDPTKGTIIECDRNAVLNFFKDSYILSKCFPKDCVYAKEEYSRKCVEDLRKAFYFEDINEIKVKNELKRILKEQSLKYKGKKKIKML